MADDGDEDHDGDGDEGGDDDADEGDDVEDDRGDDDDRHGRDDDAHADFALTITDSTGEHVRTLEGPDDAGIHELIWDWRYDAPYEPARGGGEPGSGRGPGGGFFGGAPRGPIVLPGTYTVSMEAGGETHSAEVEVIADPRRPMTRADRVTRQGALMSLHALAKPIYDAGQAADDLEGQLDAADELVDAADEAPEGLSDEIEAIRDEIEAIRDDLGEARRNAGVANAIQGSSTLPTEDHLWQVDYAWEAMPEVLERLNELIQTRVPALNDQLYAEAVRPSAGDLIELPERP
jgi:hypothetical protein